jgi:adenylate kinase family enzyme
MKYNHIHILGASGSGTTTLGKALEKEFGFVQLDTDDYYWEPTTPPYQKARERKERIELLIKDLKNHKKWVITGSLCGWGDDIIPFFDLVVFLWVPTEIRIQRLEEREIKRFGQKVLSPNKQMHKQHRKFIEWASSYDTAGMETRSKIKHKQWIKNNIKCHVLKYEGQIELNKILKDLTNRCS